MKTQVQTKSITGFPDYTISTSGVVTNVITNFEKKFHVGVNGYKTTSLSNNGYTKTVTLHRLMALHFLPNPEGKRVVNHIDGVKTNNTLSNLEWVTDSENCLHAYAMGLSNQEKLHTETELLAIFDKFKNGQSFESISDELGCATSAITVNLRKLFIKLDRECELDKCIKKNKDAAMKQAGIDKRNLITLKMIDKKTLKVVKVFNSIAEAKIYLGKSSAGPISNALSKVTKSAYGYHWIEANDKVIDYTDTVDANFWRNRKTKGTNKYVGILFRKDTGKYSCKLGKKALGCFLTEYEALQARNKYALENNMPEEVQN